MPSSGKFSTSPIDQLPVLTRESNDRELTFGDFSTEDEEANRVDGWGEMFVVAGRHEYRGLIRGGGGEGREGGCNCTVEEGRVAVNSKWGSRKGRETCERDGGNVVRWVN